MTPEETKIEQLERLIPRFKANKKIHPLKIKSMEWELRALKAEQKLTQQPETEPKQVKLPRMLEMLYSARSELKQEFRGEFKDDFQRQENIEHQREVTALIHLIEHQPKQVVTDEDANKLIDSIAEWVDKGKPLGYSNARHRLNVWLQSLTNTKQP